MKRSLLATRALPFLALPFLAPSLIACGGTDEPAPAVDREFAVLVRGNLFTSDLTAAQQRHDAVASQGEAAAKAAGDFGHDAGLGTGLFATTTTISFLGVDRWNDRDSMVAFYQDPMFASGFAELFDGMPMLEQFERDREYHSWGDLDAGDGSERWFVVVRGRLAGDDPELRKMAHNEVAAGGEAMVRAAGDVAHVAYLGLNDPKEFLAFDIWTSGDPIANVYGDPMFMQAFSSLFESQPTLQVYKISDWHQW